MVSLFCTPFSTTLPTNRIFLQLIPPPSCLGTFRILPKGTRTPSREVLSGGAGKKAGKIEGEGCAVGGDACFEGLPGGRPFVERYDLSFPD